MSSVTDTNSQSNPTDQTDYRIYILLKNDTMQLV